MRIAATLVVAGLVLSPGLAHADNEQIIKYYRKKANIPPQVQVTVTDVKDSVIKGLKQGKLQLGTPPQTNDVEFTMSADGRYVLFAETEDVTVDPGKAVMAKIDLKNEPYKGGKNAKVTIVEYSDFQCPFCTRGYNTIENQVLKEYGDKVRFYYKHYPLPFHPWAEPGAVAAECAKDQKAEAYWKIYSGLFEKQSEITVENLKEKVTAMLEGTKIDMAKWNDCYDNKKTAARVKAQMEEGSSVGVNGTPGFIINGRLVSGAQPFENFKNIIDDELASAQ